MIAVDIISGEDHIWTGFVPVLPSAGMIINLMIPGDDPKLQNFRVEGCSMMLQEGTGYAPGVIKIYVRDLTASNIITPGMIH